MIHHRTFIDRLFGRKKDPKFLDPLSLDFLKRKPEIEKAPPRGDLAPSSIFNDPSAPKADTQQPATSDTSSQPPRNRANMAAALDPRPHARKRWQRKMVIREIRGRHRMSKTTHIARTERRSLCKSPMIKTSVKKLGPLARQIAGKPIEEAIVQMRFSKKKAAKDVKRHLEYARDEAIVKRGMGLGGVKPIEDAKEPGSKAKSTSEAAENKTITIKDKNGKRRTIIDRTSIYIDEAWVGRGQYGREYEYRARGRVNMLRPPKTSKPPLPPPPQPFSLFTFYKT